MKLFGHTFGAEWIARIRATLREESGITRAGLSRRLCEWLGWRSASGQLREIDARKVLLALEREGLIELPPARAIPRQARVRDEPEDLPAPQVTGDLAALGAITLVPVSAKEPERARFWNGLMDRYHELGSGPLCGAQRRYLIHSEHAGWLGGLAFSAAAWHLAVRDQWIGWSPVARKQNLSRVVANSRFLLLPGVRVPNLASQVLGLAARTVVRDWQAVYGFAPVLLESFVDETRYAGTSYRAANWQRLGETQGRGRQDRHGQAQAGVKGIYVLPLQPDWQQVLRATSTELRLPPPCPDGDWAEREFGHIEVADGRLRERLLTVARDFMAQPQAPIPVACGGSAAKLKGAYRLLAHPMLSLDTLLKPHIEATAARMAEHPIVLAVQDTTSLNYSTHRCTEGLGPINTRADGAQGLKLHDTLAFTPEGRVLGILDAECWAREDTAAGTKSPRGEGIEGTEALRWLTSHTQASRIQGLLPNTRVVSVADREADIFELFARGRQHPHAADFLVRASRGRQRRVVVGENENTPLLWDHVQTQPVVAEQTLQIPSKGGRKARVATLQVRHTPVTLAAPKGYRGPALQLWAVHALETDPPEGHDPVEWLLLTTVAVATAEDALERLRWYALRWQIEVFHRTLKSGCRIEDRRLAEADSLQACLALDMVVAWRVMDLVQRGRETPDLPATVFFQEEEWQALHAFIHRTPELPETPPSLGTAMRMVAKIGGFLGRKHDGAPGATVIWRGLDRLSFLTETFRVFRPGADALPHGP